MPVFTATFETGVHGNTIAIGDAASLSGFVDRAFSVDSTLTYSNVQKYQKLACEMIQSATPSSCYVAWGISPALTELWGRIYLYQSGLPNTTWFPIRGFSGGSRAWEIIINSSGFVVVRDAGGTSRGTGAVASNVAGWFRIEYHIISSTTAGFMEVKLFNSPDAGLPSETITSSGSFSTLTNTELIRQGEIAALNASRTLYMDNLLVNDVGFPGPLLLPTASAFQPALRW